MTKEMLKEYIKNVPDFPRKGIMFKDISKLLYEPKAYKTAIKLLANKLSEVDLIASPGARGFLFGPPIAMMKNLPFIMVRKPGKLPGVIDKIDYELEYLKNTLEIIKNQINPGDRVAIIDDVLATGETVNAIIQLIKNQGGKVVEILFLIEILFLKGIDHINLDNDKIKSLLTF